MRSADDSPDGDVYDSLEQLKHDLRSPLTTMYGRAYLLACAIRRSPSLADDERTKMLEGLASIEVAVHALIAVIDGMGDEGGGGEHSRSRR